MPALPASFTDASSAINSDSGRKKSTATINQEDTDAGPSATTLFVIFPNPNVGTTVKRTTVHRLSFLFSLVLP